MQAVNRINSQYAISLIWIMFLHILHILAVNECIDSPEQHYMFQVIYNACIIN